MDIADRMQDSLQPIFTKCSPWAVDYFQTDSPGPEELKEQVTKFAGIVLAGSDIIFSGSHTLNVVSSQFPANRRGYPQDARVFTFRFYHMRGLMRADGLVSDFCLLKLGDAAREAGVTTAAHAAFAIHTE